MSPEAMQEQIDREADERRRAALGSQDRGQARGAGQLTPAIDPWPDVCMNVTSPDNLQTTYNGNMYWFRLLRSAGCVIETRGVETWVQPSSGPRELIGTAKFQFVSWNVLSPSSRTWEVGIDISKMEATGVWVSGGEVSAQPDCYAVTGTCEEEFSSAAFASLATDLQGTWSETSTSSGIDVAVNNFDLTFRSSPQDLAWATLRSSQPTNIRCDSLSYPRGGAPGCVSSSATPWMTGYYYTSSDTHGQAAGHIKSAQQALPDHWGLRQPAGYDSQGRITFSLQGTPLERIGGQPELTRQNRAAACAGFVPIDSNDSCDEFPFASTYQGASFISDPTRRSVAHIPRAENSLGGSVLQEFYSKNRVIDGDEFYVTVDGPEL